MPFLTNWLEMPSATPEPGPSLFDPPALRSIGARPSRRDAMLQQRDSQLQERQIQTAQKMAAYQGAMRNMEMQKLASDQARAVAPVLQSLDVRAPDYYDRAGSLLSQFPLAAEDPSVNNILQAHERTLTGIKQRQDAAAREDEEDEKMLAGDPILQQIFAEKARIEGPEAARIAVRAKRFNDAQALRLIELGEDPENPNFKINNQYFDKNKIDMLEARKKGAGGGGGRIPEGVLTKYTDAIGVSKSAMSLDEEKEIAKTQMQIYEDMYPQLKKYNSSLPASAPSATGKAPPVSGKKTSRGITFKRESD
jgi:hypothetical protein